MKVKYRLLIREGGSKRVRRCIVSKSNHVIPPLFCPSILLLFTCVKIFPFTYSILFFSCWHYEITMAKPLWAQRLNDIVFNSQRGISSAILASNNHLKLEHLTNLFPSCHHVFLFHRINLSDHTEFYSKALYMVPLTKWYYGFRHP